MKFQINEKTNAQEASFGAKLISISEEARQNANGTNYKVVTVEFKDINNEVCRTSAMIYENNYKHGLTVGETYLTTATSNDEGGAYVRMSHLVYGGVRATADMFGFEAVAAQPKIIQATF